MADLVERLRIVQRTTVQVRFDAAEPFVADILVEAADRIEALEAALASARAEAVEECARVAGAVKAPKSIGRDHGRHHEAGAQVASAAIRALFAALIEAADKWRPIKNAPKDGSMILLGRFDGQDQCLCVGCWNVYPRDGEDGLNGFNAWLDGATHWRPLPPAPPASAKGDG